MENGRILGVDYGQRRIGVALSDPLGWTAQPLAVVPNRRDAVDRLAALCREHHVAKIVIGLPLHMKGQEGVEAQAVRDFGARLAESTGLAVDYLDERLTTLQAQRMLSETEMSGAKKRAVVDKLAAALILQTWLDRHRKRP